MSIDSTTYRNLIGHFATGVTVITTDAGGSLHGMTANALTSVSLEPLLLLVCVDKGARCHAQLEAAGKFAVNILTAEQEDVSRHFAKQGEPEAGRLRGFAFRTGPQGTPLIEGCLAYLECEVTEAYPGGDHDIFLGRVLGGEKTGSGPPLLFYSGRYRQLESDEPAV